MAQVSQYYQTDSRNLSFKECWNFTRSWKFIVLGGMKILRIKLPGSIGIPYPASHRDMQVRVEDIPEICRTPIEAKVQELTDLGFHSPFYFLEKRNLIAQTESQQQGAVAMQHRSGDAVAIAIHVHHVSGLTVISKTVTGIVSLRNDGTFLGVFDSAEQLKGVPEDSVIRLVDASPAELWGAHEKLLFGGRDPEMIKKVKSEADLIKLLDYNGIREFDFHIKRGFYTLMADRDVELMREQMASRNESSAALGHSELPVVTSELPVDLAEPVASTKPPTSTELPELYTDVLAEIQRKEREKPGWGNALIILGISAFIFMAAGSLRWTWETTLLLLVVLLVHELGHFVAMKLFQYRNVRMFFIPLFGAAVSGKHYNVPGWKKVIVSLMGPLPGILLGAILGSLGMLLGQSYLTNIAIMFLILNGFNLLPFLPLDGGWVLHSTLFCRHYLLDTVFRALAGVGFIVGWLVFDALVFLFLGVIMLLALPVSYRKAKAVHSLKLKGVPASASDGDTIPPETARMIVDEIKATYNHANLHTKILAQHTVQIFESLNARPPGWLGSGAALLAQTTGFVMAILFCVVFIFGPNPGMLSDLADVSKFAMFGEDVPKHRFDCSEDISWVGADVDATTELLDQVMIATIESPGKLEELNRDLSSNLPGGAACRKFGQTLFLAVPEDASKFRDEWVARFEEHTKDVFVHSARYPATVSLAFRSPNGELAEKLESEMSSFLMTVPWGNLIPPWQPDDTRDPGLKAMHAKARATYGLIQSKIEESYEPEAGDELSKKMQIAVRRGDQKGVERLQAEEDEKRRARELKAVAPLRQNETLDIVTIDLWEEAQEEIEGGDNEEAFEALYERMGVLPSVDGEVQSGADRYSVRWGMAIREGVEIHLSQLRFISPSHGLPALAEWLCSQGCDDIRYSFSTYGYED